MTVEEARDRFERAVNWYAYIKAMYGNKPEHAGDVQLAFEDLLSAGDDYNLARKAVAAVTTVAESSKRVTPETVADYRQEYIKAHGQPPEILVTSANTARDNLGILDAPAPTRLALALTGDEDRFTYLGMDLVIDKGCPDDTAFFITHKTLASIREAAA